MNINDNLFFSKLKEGEAKLIVVQLLSLEVIEMEMHPIDIINHSLIPPI